MKSRARAKNTQESKEQRRQELEASLAEDCAYLARLEEQVGKGGHQYQQVEAKCRLWKRLLQELET
jgi:hypothetical protein